MEKVRVGLIGTGFSADFHAKNYRLVHDVEFELRGVNSAEPFEEIKRFAERFKIPRPYRTVDELLADPEINVVDICVPNLFHVPLAIRAAEAGKHVICEKPLTGYYGTGDEGPDEQIGKTIPKKEMVSAVLAQVAAVEQAVRRTGVKFMYAENWVYAPPIAKAERLLSAAGGTILRIRGEESHSGSHASYSYQWRTAGGGALLGKGCHPLGAALYLKIREGLRKDVKPIRPVGVLAQTARLTEVPGFVNEERKFIRTGWKDVEDWGTMLVTFSDGSVAEITASDTVLGGVHNTLEIYASNARIHCNISPTDACTAYAPEASIFGDEYIMEKIETKGGWSYPAPDEDWMTGYQHELQDFVECVAIPERQPRSGLMLARDCVSVIYHAYISAEEGRKVEVKLI